jgi:hypothetical protein
MFTLVEEHAYGINVPPEDIHQSDIPIKSLLLNVPKQKSVPKKEMIPRLLLALLLWWWGCS